MIRFLWLPLSVSGITCSLRTSAAFEKNLGNTQTYSRHQRCQKIAAKQADELCHVTEE